MPLAGRSGAVVLWLAAALGGCGRETVGNLGDSGAPKASAAAWFVDVAPASGLDFVHDPGFDGSFAIPQIMGSGGALFDYDGDGDLDIYLVNGGPYDRSRRDSPAVNRLFRREAEGRYVDVTETSGLGDPGYGMGTAVGDIDNDGDLDLYVTNFGPDVLYRNDGDGTFTEISGRAGVDAPRFSSSAAFLDLDGDGWLDLYVVRYVTVDPSRVCRDQAGRVDFCGPLHGVADLLYRNDGDGTFTDISRSSGVGGSARNGLGLVSADFDRDGRVDLFVANDGESNALWINRGEWRFTDLGLVMGVAINLFGEPEAGMGVGVGDLDGSGAFDLFLTHMRGETNTFYASVEGGMFVDATAASGLGAGSFGYTGFGTDLFDLDHDGDLDLAVVNGRIERGADRTGGAGGAPRASARSLEHRREYGEPNLLFGNDGSGRFQNLCERAGDLCASVEVGRGLLTGDVDRDGDLDLLVTNSNGPAQLFRNDVPAKGRWLVVRALDRRLGRDALGAEISVRLDGREIVRPVTHTRGYLTSSAASAHFGVGKAERLPELTVVWPGGARQRILGLPTDRYLSIGRSARGEG